MADIKGQLIKDSYNYVLQADIATGIVYRIGGAVPTNLIFQSGITVNGSFTYSDGSQQNGYVLTCDAFGNSSWKPVSAATPSSGVTSVTTTNNITGTSTTGAVTIGLSNDITVNSINATTYYNLPTQVTGSDTWIQFNDGGNFGSDSTLTYDKVNLVFVGGTNSGFVDTPVTESFLIGGHNNSINGTSTHGGIVGSYLTTIQDSTNSVIVGGNNHLIGDGSVSSVIVGGDGSKGANVIRNTDSGVILGGTGNEINGTQFSVIVGGVNNSIVSNDNSVVVGGSGINATASNFVYVPNLNINSVPTNDDTLTQVLVRDNAGDVKYRNASSFGGGSATGAYLPLSGGTVSGATVFSDGFTANTIVVGPTPSLYTTTSTTVTTGTNTIYSVSKTLYNSIFIDYSLSGSTGKRAGTIVGIWDGSSIEYNETSTVDIGNTSAVVFSLSLTTTANLVATISSSTWLIKTIIKSI